MAKANPGASKGDFLAFIKKASQDRQLLLRFLDFAYEHAPGRTPEELEGFFVNERYYGVSLEDCRKLKEVISAGPLPCNFRAGAMY